jgi:hypothetical protein
MNFKPNRDRPNEGDALSPPENGPRAEVIMQHDQNISSSLHARPGALRFFTAISLLAFTMIGAIGACTPEEQPPAQCVGGIINADGVCEGKCTPDKCLPGNTCVGNRCVLVCDSHTDCLEDGTQDCAPAVEDDTNAAIMTCQSNGIASGVGIKCPFVDECASLFSCKTTGERCDLSQCGGAADACKIDTEACYAQANCNIGKCPDGSACTVFSCSPQECTAELTCISNGDGDAAAYCTKNDCADDSDCPGGYYCGVTHDPRALCDSNPPKGNNGFCGKVSINTPCVPESDLGNGNTLFEGQLCLLRKTCLVRTDCAPCTTDLDCTGIANRCVSMPGESQKRCARDCLTLKECPGDAYACTAIDEANPDAGRVCRHKFGACTGTGKFCEPCQNDTECGPLTGTGACYEFDGEQRVCFSACNSNADCPTAPSGAPGVCLLDDPASVFYKHCVPDGARCY